MTLLDKNPLYLLQRSFMTNHVESSELSDLFNRHYPSALDKSVFL
jgi:hypothetical protein